MYFRFYHNIQQKIPHNFTADSIQEAVEYKNKFQEWGVYNPKLYILLYRTTYQINYSNQRIKDFDNRETNLSIKQIANYLRKNYRRVEYWWYCDNRVILNTYLYFKDGSEYRIDEEKMDWV